MSPARVTVIEIISAGGRCSHGVRRGASMPIVVAGEADDGDAAANTNGKFGPSMRHHGQSARAKDARRRRRRYLRRSMPVPPDESDIYKKASSEGISKAML